MGERGATADVRAGEVRLVDVAMRDEEGRPAYQLTLQVEPTARVLYYLPRRQAETDCTCRASWHKTEKQRRTRASRAGSSLFFDPNQACR